MDPYIVRDGKRLRKGYTTGSCAAAAAKAAAWLLLSGEKLSSVQISTPNGTVLDLEVSDTHTGKGSVSCSVRKDSGDDPDVTNGILITAEVSETEEPGIRIDGGAGIGRVTKPGLDQPVGEAAINSVPRRMIRENLESICRVLDHHGGLSVIISAPEGEELAKKTFNPRLGITGGISILGTSGIVEPMSEQALIDTIRIELKQRRLSGTEHILLTPGNYGRDFIQSHILPDTEKAVMVSNFIGDALDICGELGFTGMLLIGHIGKLVKLAGGMLNTHSRYGDCRMEILASYAAASGLPSAEVRRILECVTCDQAIGILKENRVFHETMDMMIQKIALTLQRRAEGKFETGVMVFSNVHGLLCETENAGELLCHIKEEDN